MSISSRFLSVILITVITVIDKISKEKRQGKELLGSSVRAYVFHDSSVHVFDGQEIKLSNATTEACTLNDSASLASTVVALAVW
jgi:surface polysaccharide O-acyltransferase-like enzyme